MALQKEKKGLANLLPKSLAYLFIFSFLNLKMFKNI